MRNFKLFVWILLSTACLSSCASYNTIMRKAVKKSLGKDFKGYYGFSYPTNNFGLITSFEDKLKSANQYCAMIGCLDGISIPDMDGWLDLNGLADVGNGGPIRLSESKKTKIAVDAVLPKLWNVLQLDGDLQSTRSVTTSLNIGPAHVRFLNRKKFEEYINVLPVNNLYKAKYEAGKFVIVVSDVVVEYLSVKIEVDQSLEARLDAAIQSGHLGEKFEELNLDASFDKTSQGTFELTIEKPVIILRLAKRQPSTKEFLEYDNYDNWISEVDFIQHEHK